MRFFKKKKTASEAEQTIEQSEAAKTATPAESVCEVELPSAPVDAIVPPTGTKKSNGADEAGTAPVSAIPSSSMHLFPGFEDQSFSIGYNVQGDKSVLMMRWDTQEPSSWFEVPAMFNNAIIAKIQERENEKDLSRLLRDYGYEVDRPSLQAAE